MGKKAEQKRRNHVIQVILDAYESGNADWRTYPDPNARGNRTIWITQELYDEIGKRELNQQVLDLQQEKLLRDGTGRDSSGWLVRGSELEKITYQLESIPVFYERDSRIPRYIRHYGPLRELTGELEKLKGAAKRWKPWLLCCIEAMEQDVGREKIPKICQDAEKKKVYFQTLRGLNELEEPVYRRVFSKHYLGDSKRFEQIIQKQILRDARRWNERVEADEEVMDDRTVLVEIGLETYHQELAVKGSLRFLLKGTEVDTAAWRYGTVLNAETLKHLELLPEQKICKIISIENKANYMSVPFEEGTLYLYSHGFFSPAEREFLRELRKCLHTAGTGTEYYHSGDLDYGGMRIFMHIQKEIFPDLKPWRMDWETLEHYREQGEPREPEYLKKIKELEVPPELQELKAAILESGITLEQEAFLWE